MTSAYNKDQRKVRLYKAIKMRDEIIERINRKTRIVERFQYSRDWIKNITGIKRYEAIHLGIYPKKPTTKEMMDAHNKATAKRVKQSKSNLNRLTPRRIKEQ